MKIKNLSILMLCFYLGACASMSTLQTAETLPEGTGEFSAGAGYINHKAILEGDSESEATAPYLEFQYRRGLAPKWDAGVKVTLIGTGGADVKYQLIDSDKFDLAVGAGLAYMSIESGDSKSTLIDVTLPVYMSTPVSESVTLYASPKYFLRKATGGDALNILAMTAGVKMGEKSGIMLESSYGKAIGDDFQSLQFNAAFFVKGDAWL